MCYTGTAKGVESMAETDAHQPEVAAPVEESAPAEAPAGEDRDGSRFRPGDTVVISEAFHSSYFRGLTGVVDGESIRGATGQTLWPLKIDVPPYRTLIPAEYLRPQEATGAAARRGFWARLFSGRRQ